MTINDQSPVIGSRPGETDDARKINNARATAGTRLVALLRLILLRVIIEPIRDGRPRDRGWPYGLRAVVLVAGLLYLIGALLVIFAGVARHRLPLAVDPGGFTALPRPLLMVLMIMIVGVLGLAYCAALRGPWWLKVLTVAAVWLVLGMWGLHLQTSLLYWLVPVAMVIAMLVLLVGMIVRSRKPFAWWEFPVAFLIIGLSLALAVAADSYGVSGYGIDLVGAALLQTLSVVGMLAAPALFAAGVAVAEFSVNAAVSIARIVGSVRGRHWIYLLLGVVAVLRIGLTVRTVLAWDRVEVDAAAWAAGGITIVLLIIAVVLIERIGSGRKRGPSNGGRIAGHPTDGRILDDADDLPEVANRMGLPVGAALIAAYVPVMMLTFVAAIGVALAPSRQSGGVTNMTRVLDWIGSDQPVAVFRAVVGVIIFCLAIRWARRRRIGRARLAAVVAVLLISNLTGLFGFLGYRTGLQPQVLALVAGLVVLIMIVVDLLRARLTAARAAAATAALGLSMLLGNRDVVSDPVGVLIGYSGVGLALFGLTWDLLTGSEWGNGDSRRWPLPSRLMLVLANSLFAVVVLGYGSLARVVPSAVPDADQWSGLGDWYLGSALVLVTLMTVLHDGLPGRSAAQPTQQHDTQQHDSRQPVDDDQTRIRTPRR